ncbi:hypothetical protein FRUB_04850 [Fimbriiglobus ruber]|uniref:Uncharacterized protein n=1 Tax=Fimbriiglobus ruber TaxID=1908690 RepID=A0A225DQS9_9BACT|nr:hypothetical protein FRUB_04850 [Fimbriiglobus ruber]
MFGGKSEWDGQPLNHLGATVLPTVFLAKIGEEEATQDTNKTP